MSKEIEQEQVEEQVPQRNHKRRKWVAFGLVGVLAMGGAAYAYYSATGSGSGDTQAGTSTPMTIAATITPDATGLVPGGVPAGVSFAVDNPAANDQRVATIHLASVTAFTDAGHTTPAAGCVTADFTVADVAANEVIPAGTTPTVASTGTLVFADSGINQDACKSAYLVLAFTSN